MTGALEPRRTRRFPLFSLAVFAGLLIFAAVYVSRTVRLMPPIVASHFDATGEANGFMLRDQYRVFMPIAAVALPFGVVALLAADGLRAATQRHFLKIAVNVISGTLAKALDKGQFCFAPAASS